MLELNKVMLVGRLTRDPEVRYLQSGTAIADLTLAVGRTWFDRTAGERKEETAFVDVTAWDKQAEFCGKWLQKGRPVYVEGRLRQDKWEDKQTGQNRSKLVVVAERVAFADSKPQQGGGQPGEVAEDSGYGESGGGGYQARPAQAPARPAAPAPARAPEPSMQQPPQTEDDLPF